MTKELRDPRTIDSASAEMLELAKEQNIPTAFDRADTMKPCPIRQEGLCCRLCFMGPCRLTKDGQTGICGATIETITSRNFARAVAAGAVSHSDHGRDLAITLLAASKGEAQGYKIRDPFKLKKLAKELGIPTEGREIQEIGVEVAEACLAMFGQQTGELAMIERAPEKRATGPRPPG